MAFTGEGGQFLVKGEVKIHDKDRKDRRVVIRTTLL